MLDSIYPITIFQRIIILTDNMLPVLVKLKFRNSPKLYTSKKNRLKTCWFEIKIKEIKQQNIERLNPLIRNKFI